MDKQEEDVQVEQEIAEQEETTNDSEVEETPEEETITVSKEKFKAMQKKAIAFDANKKAPPKNINNTLSREEAILIAKGRSEDELDLLHTIAKGKGVSLLDAEKNPLFLAYEEKQSEEKKKEQARLGASKGSGYSEAKDDFNKPGLTNEEHKELWKKSMSR